MNICTRFTIVASLILGIALNTSLAQSPDDPLANLRTERPRLILQPGELDRIRNSIMANETHAEYKAQLIKRANKILTQPLVEYKIVGPRLLTQSRNCLDRVYTLGLLYKLDGTPRYWNRLRYEIFAAAAFEDWNPSHFLDTAEMTHAFAIAYDWFYDEWSEKERDLIRNAMIDKGLKPALDGYRNDSWWIDVHHNWNQVCNGGIGIGALAIADEEPRLAKEILTNAIANFPKALKSYAPDGGWEEGPMYWHYATRYSVYFMASLITALNTDFGLGEHPGFGEGGLFYMHANGPLGLAFNYADAGTRISPAHELLWMAVRFNEPVYAWYQRDMLDKNPSSISALDLIWFTDIGDNPEVEGIPLHDSYGGIDVAFFRSQWDNPDAMFVGFKGGDNAANHSHLDLGCFVLDALGVRWAIDLGSDNYNLPGYFGGKRWTYFRLNTQSHNTLIINGQNQNTKARAPIVSFEEKVDYAFAIADLDLAYDDATLQRGIAMQNGERVIVQDEFSLDETGKVTWQIMTDATIETDSNTATLSRDDQQLVLRILTPEGATFSVTDGNPEPPQRQLENAQLLQVVLEEQQQGTISVVFEPVMETGTATTWDHRPLSEW